MIKKTANAVFLKNSKIKQMESFRKKLKNRESAKLIFAIFEKNRKIYRRKNDRKKFEKFFSLKNSRKKKWPSKLKKIG